MSQKASSILILLVVAFCLVLHASVSFDTAWPKWGLNAIALLALAYLGYMLLQLFDRMENIRSLLTAYSKGDLRKRLKLGDGDHEIDMLALETNKVGVGFTEVMGELRGANQVLVAAIDSFEKTHNTVEMGANQIKDLSHSVAAGAEQSSSGLDLVSQSAGGMSDAVNMVAAAMEEMVASAGEIQKRCEEENVVVKKSQGEAANADAAMRELHNLVGKIGAITQVIEEIASQTNLLALNATIEAAGAGDAGKGFTVVANEVKQLSRQTATATGDIRGQIEQIQTVAANVSARISQVAKIILDIESSSQGTLNAVQEQRTTISSISQNLAQASVSASQIAKGISEVSIGARGTAESIAKVHAEAERTTTQMTQTGKQAQAISQTSKRLGALVSFFKAEAVKAQLTPDLYTNVGNVDQQHRRLFDIINDLSAAVVEGRGADHMVKVFNALLDYTAVHFREEEDMLRKSHYPDYDNHIKLHHVFEAKVKQARDDYSSGKGMVASEIIRFLTEWLVVHIGKVDHKYIPCVKKAGY